MRPADVLRCPCVAREQPAALGWVCTGDRVLHRPHSSTPGCALMHVTGAGSGSPSIGTARVAHTPCARAVGVRAIIVNMSAAQVLARLADLGQRPRGFKE